MTAPAFAGGAPDVVVPIPETALGAPFGRFRRAMTVRRIQAYAAGIGATDPLYLDDARPGGIVAPLGITASTDWNVFVQPDYLAALGRTPETAFNSLVHGFQVSDWHRPIRPGDVLEVSARIVELRATRAGSVVTARIDTVLAEDGTPVATGWFGAMYRGTPLAGAAGAVEPCPALRDAAGIEAPALCAEIPIPPGQAHIYTECADIWNPIHTERAYALASGLPDIILHGTCTWAMALQRLAAAQAPESPLPFRRFGARFSGVVVPGQPVTLEAAAPQDGRIAFAVRNAEGRLALSHGVAELA